MKKFIIDKSFWNIFPNAKLGIVIINNIINDLGNGKTNAILKKANREAEKYLKSSIFSENPIVKSWREAFSKFKTKKGARCSIEELLKRIEKQNPVKEINTIVDIYNSASLFYGLPCGAEDIDSINGDLTLTITEGGDDFLPIGEEENDLTLQNELCYKDNIGAVCRCFNWRDGKRTMIQQNTKNVFLVMEIVDDSKFEDLKNALQFLKENYSKYLEFDKIETHLLSKENPEIIIY